MRDRLDHMLYQADKTCIYQCLIDLMIHEEWLTNSYLVDDDLIQKLIPRLALDNFDWYNVKSIQDI